jgi:hypothetical protein
MECTNSPYVVPISSSCGIAFDCLATESWQYTPYILYEEKSLQKLLWRIDPLLGRDLEANNGTATVAV